MTGKEIGEKGTPHLQGFFKFKNAKTFNSLKKNLTHITQRFHIEKMRGNIKQNINYCEKEGDYIKPLTFKEKLNQLVIDREYKDVKWKDWQAKILSELKEIPDNRKINFIVDYIGNKGKSYLCKYILMNENGAIIADGKKDNVFNQILNAINNEKMPEIILLDVPRSGLEYLNYGIIEQIKNGFIYSGKYEGGQCIFPIPHVYIFMNARPDMHKLSNDRYNVIMLE